MKFGFYQFGISQLGSQLPEQPIDMFLIVLISTQNDKEKRFFSPPMECIFLPEMKKKSFLKC